MQFYDTYPTLFWAVLSTGLVAGLITLIFGAYTNNIRLGYISLGIVILLLTIYYLLPATLGYALYGRGHTDILAHWGYVKTIEKTGKIASQDWYPLLHIFLRQLRDLGLSKAAASGLTAALFNTLLLIGLMVYGQRLTGSKRGGLFVAAAGVPPVYMLFHRSLHPFILSFFTIPLVLTAISLEKSPWQARGLAILFGVFFVCFHPTTSLYFLGLLALRTLPNPLTTIGTRTRTVNSSLFLGLGSLWTAWYFLIFQRVELTLSKFFINFLAASEGAAVNTANVASRSSLSLWDTILRGVQLYGPPLTYIGLGGLIVAALCYYLIRTRETHPWLSTLIGMEYAIGVIFAALFLFVLPILGRPVRAVHFAILPASVLIGMALHRTAASKKQLIGLRPTQVLAIVVIIMLVLTPIATMEVYRDGRHLTASNIEGTDWYLTHSGDSGAVSLLMSHKLVRYLYGYDTAAPFEFQAEMNQNLYAGEESLSDAYTNQQYLLIKQFDIDRVDSLTPSQRAETTFVSKEELRRVNSDPTAARIYSSGGYRIWSFNSSG